MSLDLRVELATFQHLSAIEQLFIRNQVPCHCRFWEYAGDKNGWLARCVQEPELNQKEFADALAFASTRDPMGVVALEASQGAVGWMKLCYSQRIPKLYSQRLYKNLPSLTGERNKILTIGCFLVDEEWRRRGVARALLNKGVMIARDLGAEALEAFPRRYQSAHDGELWTGPANLFSDAGFEEVEIHPTYPIMRLNFQAVGGRS